MKTLLTLILLVSSIASAQTNGLSLAQVHEKVLAGNPSVREAVQRIAAAEAVLKQARSAYLPTLTASVSYGYSDVDVQPASFASIHIDDHFTSTSAGLEANWLLFDGFARRARSLSAKYGVEQSRELAGETRRLLVQAATVSFRQAQLARENVAISKRDLAFNRNLEEDSRKRFKAGATPESDVHNFSIRALQAETAELQAELDYKTACTVLAELMALPEARLPEALQPVSIEFTPNGTIPEMESEFKYALAHRPDYKAFTAGRLALAQQVRAAKGDLLPTVGLTGSADYYEDLGDVYFVGVGASWDLFSGGRKVNTVKQAQAEMRALEEQQESLRLSIRSSLQQRIDEAELSKAVFQRAEKIHKLSSEVRDSVEKAYKAGAAPITRLNEVQTDLVRARGAYATSYIAYQLVLNQLDIETGRILKGLE